MECVFEEESAYAILDGKETAAIKHIAQVIALVMVHVSALARAVYATLGTQGKSATIWTVLAVETALVGVHVSMGASAFVKRDILARAASL